MRKYIIDQVMFLAAGIGIMICIPHICGPKITLLLEALTAISWGYLCRRILLLPMDILCGKVTQNVYFSAQMCLEDLEFFKRKYCPEWKFVYQNKTLLLLVPIAADMDELQKIEQPRKDEIIRITYFRFSKILLSYEPV